VWDTVPTSLTQPRVWRPVDPAPARRVGLPRRRAALWASPAGRPHAPAILRRPPHRKPRRRPLGRRSRQNLRIRPQVSSAGRANCRPKMFVGEKLLKPGPLGFAARQDADLKGGPPPKIAQLCYSVDRRRCRQKSMGTWGWSRRGCMQTIVLAPLRWDAWRNARPAACRALCWWARPTHSCSLRGHSGEPYWIFKAASR
jgi:hypothetical protein